MHISEGVLSAPVLLSGALLTAGGVAMGLRRMDHERIPRVAVLSAGFFVASLIHVPVWPASVHLVLNGLLGIVLGWAAFPAILVALLLQAVLFDYGGVTTLGVNTLNMAAPAVVCYYVFRRPVVCGGPRLAFAGGLGAGALAVAGGCAMIGLCYLFTERAFLGVAAAILLAHLPVLVIEGLVTGAVVAFLRRTRPELLEWSPQVKEPAGV